MMLKVDKLTKKYGDKTVVNGLSIEVKRGSIYGLIGPNGAGKTTTIACILGLKKHCEGFVQIMDQEVRLLKHRIGVQFQTDYFPEKIKVIEMVEMMAVLYDNPVDYHSLLTMFDLEDKKKQMVSKLSGGERQRLSILLALINDPEIVFLDELTTGLDPQARREVWALLRDLNKKGMTIFMTSHFMDEVDYLCDEIHLINKGETVFKGTSENILSFSGMQDLESAYLYLIGGGENEKVH